MNKKKVVITVIFISLLVYGGTRNQTERALSIFSSIASIPLLKSATFFSQWCFDPLANFKDAQTVKQELRAVEAERDALLQELIRLRATTWYLDRTADLVSFNDRYQYNPTFCGQIILKILNSKTHYGFIDRGSVDGVKPGMIATFKNMLVGKVVEVYPFLSKLLFITDPTCTVAASGTTSKASGICRGKADSRAINFEFVSALTPLHQNELIISNGTGSLFPAGFGIGTVETIEGSELYQKAQLKPLINVEAIDYCYILERSAEPILTAHEQINEEILVH